MIYLAKQQDDNSLKVDSDLRCTTMAEARMRACNLHAVSGSIYRVVTIPDCLLGGK